MLPTHASKDISGFQSHWFIEPGPYDCWMESG